MAFYDDTGGVIWTRAGMITNTKKYVCEKFRRERIAGSLNVYTIKDFGAIASSSPRFCRFSMSSLEEA